MKRFFIPNDKLRFISWLLKTSKKNDWTVVLEYSGENATEYVKSIVSKMPIPVSCKHEYNSDCMLSAIKFQDVTDDFINNLIALTHVLSVHSNEKLIFLIADDFHEECFSGSDDFAIKYSKELVQKNLVARVL